MMKKTTMLLAALGCSALAWVPELDEKTAKDVIDTAYNRRVEPVRTYQFVDLKVKDGNFVAGPQVVTMFDGEDSCLKDWTLNPGAYAAHGSRPTSITIGGQADDLFLRAEQARNSFKNLSVQDALKPGEGQLAPGTLRVYVSMTGLADEKLRDAYMLAVRTPDGQLIQPSRRAFTNDWKQMTAESGAADSGSTNPDAAGRWTGSMVYYFDAAKAGVTGKEKVQLLLRTEADNNCAYAVPVDLGSFY